MKKHQRTFSTPTAVSLARAAAEYLARFSASESSLRQTLRNRLRRAVMRIESFAADTALQESLRGEIERIIERHKNSGVLNDTAYAETKVNSLRRAGRSRRFIEQKLAQKGVEAGIAQAVIAAVDADNFEAADRESQDESSDELSAELAAAMRFAKRRRLGRYRQKEMNEDQFRKDLATLARSGFSLDIARKALKDKGARFNHVKDHG